MRTVLVAVIVALLSTQAHAQMGIGQGGGGDKGAADAAKDGEQKKRRAKEEAAAKAAMQRVPDSKEKYDPWKIGK
jgi:hypothetical protein